MNGWTQNNHRLREKLVKLNNPDIVCLTEMDLRNNENINVPNFVFFGLNHMTTCNLNKCGSGGVGILVKNTMLSDYEVSKTLELYETVLGLKLRSKQTGKSFVVYCTYLPPENSRYDRTNEEILNCITIDFYRNIECTHLVVCGDLNARIGNCDDCDTDGNIPCHKVLDPEINSQGAKGLEFVNDIKGVVLNGRVTPELDDFTSVMPHKGRSVVDYIIVRQNEFSAVKELKVMSCIDVIESNNWENLISPRSRPPDHNIVCAKIELSPIAQELLSCRNLGSKRIRRK